MTRTEYLKEEIERERRTLNEMLVTMVPEEALAQSRKLDCLMEEYLDLVS